MTAQPSKEIYIEKLTHKLEKTINQNNISELDGFLKLIKTWVLSVIKTKEATIKDIEEFINVYFNKSKLSFNDKNNEYELSMYIIFKNLKAVKA